MENRFDYRITRQNSDAHQGLRPNLQWHIHNTIIPNPQDKEDMNLSLKEPNVIHIYPMPLPPISEKPKRRKWYLHTNKLVRPFLNNLCQNEQPNLGTMGYLIIYCTKYVNYNKKNWPFCQIDCDIMNLKYRRWTSISHHQVESQWYATPFNL